ncbi:MAG: ATP-binding protein, partial [Chloroflexi bacterium]|nr:ATP-binding protein [Chloroflexota bacterium]
MNEQTTCAKVSPKLLTKADRLFTGTIEGRIIELLQNARRAGATEVRITNKNNLVTVEDNGSGIQDFQKLLDLGSSGWNEKIESGEDPAGVGLFSLAPRQVTIISENSKLVITKHGWTGTPV